MTYNELNNFWRKIHWLVPVLAALMLLFFPLIVVCVLVHYHWDEVVDTYRELVKVATYKPWRKST